MWCAGPGPPVARVTVFARFELEPPLNIIAAFAGVAASHDLIERPRVGDGRHGTIVDMGEWAGQCTFGQMGNPEERLRMYTELATWWPLLSPPSEYVEEAADLLPVLLGATDTPPHTLLELGCGGGSLAYHLKTRLALTLTDRSAEMLAISRQVNPECEHVLGDMRSMDLGRQFDLVLIHDAIMYATDPAAVRATLATAHRHCRPGGAVVLLPDCVRETFEPTTEHGGEDAADGRGLRYIEWSWDPDPDDDTFEVAYGFLLRESNGAVHVESDRHRCGLFSRAAWSSWLAEIGFVPSSRIDPWNREVFVGKRPRGSDGPT
jgi:SAM-dependent methyltransferase